MRIQLLATAIILAGCLSGHAAPPGKVALVPPKRVSDATHFERRSAEEVEVVIAQLWPVMGARARQNRLLAFQLNRKPVATFFAGEAVRLYLRPGRYRLGVIPTSNPHLHRVTEIEIQVTKGTRMLYRVFQSAGFTSGFGEAVFEFERVREP